MKYKGCREKIMLFIFHLILFIQFCTGAEFLLSASPPIYGNVLLNIPNSGRIISVGGDFGDLSYLGASGNELGPSLTSTTTSVRTINSIGSEVFSKVSTPFRNLQSEGTASDTAESRRIRLLRTAAILSNSTLPNLIFLSHTSTNFTLSKEDLLDSGQLLDPEADALLLKNLVGCTAHFINKTHIIVLFGGRGSFDQHHIHLRDTHQVSLIDLERGIIQQLHTWFPPEGRFGHVSIYNERTNRVYMYGGYVLGNETVSDTLYFLSLDTLVWTPFNPFEKQEQYIRTGQFGASSVALDNEKWLICFGVYASSHMPSSDCTIFDIANHLWIKPSYEGATNPEPRQGASLVRIPGSDRVVAVGGYNNMKSEFLSDLVEFVINPDSDKIIWKEPIYPQSSMQSADAAKTRFEAKAWHVAAMIDDENMVLWGGRSKGGVGDGKLYVLNTATMLWSPGNVSIFDVGTGVMIVSIMGMMFLTMVAGVMGIMIYRWCKSRKDDYDFLRSSPEQPKRSACNASTEPSEPDSCNATKCSASVTSRTGPLGSGSSTVSNGKKRNSTVVTPPVPIAPCSALKKKVKEMPTDEFARPNAYLQRGMSVQNNGVTIVPADISESEDSEHPSDATMLVHGDVDLLGMETTEIVLNLDDFAPVPNTETADNSSVSRSNFLALQTKLLNGKATTTNLLRSLIGSHSTTSNSGQGSISKQPTPNIRTLFNPQPKHNPARTESKSVFPRSMQQLERYESYSSEAKDLSSLTEDENFSENSFSSFSDGHVIPLSTQLTVANFTTGERPIATFSKKRDSSV